MTRACTIAFALALAAAPALAQESAPNAADLGLTQLAPDPALDPTEPGAPVDPALGDRRIEGPIPTFRDDALGPPLAGPSQDNVLADRPIGPPLAGPVLEEGLPLVDARRLVRLAEEEQDAFAAPGIRVGTFVLRPTLEAGAVAATNPDGGEQSDPAAGLLTATDTVLRSDWSRHEVAVEVRGRDIEATSEALSERFFEARGAGRLDVTARTTIDAAAAYRYEQEGLSDPDTPEDVAERPSFRVLAAELGATHRLNRLGFDLRGTLTRTIYDDVRLLNGDILNRDDENNNVYEARLRGSYSTGAALEPFAQAQAGRVVYDETVDSAGFRRSSRFVSVSSGLIVDRSPKLLGEASIGYRHEVFDDRRLQDLDAVLVAASLLWSPERLTNVRLEVTTSVNTSATEDVSGSIVHTASLGVARRLQADLEAETGVSVARERFVGSGSDQVDTTFSAFAAAEYDLNRYAALLARVDYAKTWSSEPDGDETNLAVSARLRLQR